MSVRYCDDGIKPELLNFKDDCTPGDYPGIQPDWHDGGEAEFFNPASIPSFLYSHNSHIQCCA